MINRQEFLGSTLFGRERNGIFPGVGGGRSRRNKTLEIKLVSRSNCIMRAEWTTRDSPRRVARIKIHLHSVRNTVTAKTRLRCRELGFRCVHSKNISYVFGFSKNIRTSEILRRTRATVWNTRLKRPGLGDKKCIWIFQSVGPSFFTKTKRFAETILGQK